MTENQKKYVQKPFRTTICKSCRRSQREKKNECTSLDFSVISLSLKC